MERRNGREGRGDWVEWARSAWLAPYFGAHLAQCPECARFLERQNAPSRSLGDLKEEFNAQTMPPRIEAALLAEFDRRSPRKPGHARAFYMTTAAGGALAASLVSALAFWPHRRR